MKFEVQNVKQMVRWLWIARDVKPAMTYISVKGQFPAGFVLGTSQMDVSCLGHPNLFTLNTGKARYMQKE